MPYVQPAGVTAGTTITEAWGDSVAAAFTWLANPPACRVYHNTTQSVADVTETTVAFNAERYDTAAMHDTVTNNSRITIPAAGLYAVSFSGEFGAGTDYLCLYSICRLNAGTIIGRSSTARHDSGDGSPAATSFGFTYKFVAGDFIEVRMYHNNGANVARNVLSTGNSSPEFAATWVGLG